MRQWVGVVLAVVQEQVEEQPEGGGLENEGTRWLWHRSTEAGVGEMAKRTERNKYGSMYQVN